MPAVAQGSEIAYDVSTQIPNVGGNPCADDQPRDAAPRHETIARIAVAVDAYPEGSDAVVLGSAIARATDAELMLVTVNPQQLVVAPPGMDWKELEKHAHAILVRARDSFAPRARIMTETDLSVPRALQRVVRREHRDLLVVGSSRHAPEGKVRIGKRTRQLLYHFESALAIAPRGMHAQPAPRLQRIGVGYDGGPESRAALALARSISVACGAELRVRGVVDDRAPAMGWPKMWLGGIVAEWQEMLNAESESLLERAVEAAGAGAAVQAEVQRGRPADALLKLSAEVDLLVIGSRRWGPVARLLLGSTGEALAREARCPLVVVPRPPESASQTG